MIALPKLCIKSWQDFLDSLSTAGGNIVVLMACSVGLTFLMLHLSHHGSDSTLVEMGKTTLAGFSGALLQALRSNASRQQMTDRNETAAPGPKPAATFLEVTK